jgi:hypothetical protein
MRLVGRFATPATRSRLVIMLPPQQTQRLAHVASRGMVEGCKPPRHPSEPFLKVSGGEVGSPPLRTCSFTRAPSSVSRSILDSAAVDIPKSNCANIACMNWSGKAADATRDQPLVLISQRLAGASISLSMRFHYVSLALVASGRRRYIQVVNNKWPGTALTVPARTRRD